MLTKNYFNLLAVNGAGESVPNGITDCSGASYTIYAPSNAWMPFYAIDTLAVEEIYTSSVGVRIGSGTKPATIDDITLEAPIISGLTITNPSAPSVSKENDHIKISATYGITNKGTIAQTITEIGMFGSYYNKNGNSGSTKSGLLFDRTVLEKPITINPGESKQLTYTIRFNYPTE